MKKFICLLLVLAIGLSLASCSLKDELTETTAAIETTTLPVPVIESSTHKKEFKDENGRTVYTVDVVVPHLEEFDNDVLKSQINILSLDIFEEACEKAESNIVNAAKFMDSRSSETPWSRKIDFEISFSDGRYISFIIRDYFSTLGGETEPSLSSATFNVLDGSPCYLTAFASEDISKDELSEKIVEKLLCPAVSSFFRNNLPLTEEDKQLVHDSFYPENFYLTSDGIGFYISSYVFEPSSSGEFTVHFTWDEVNGILSIPE